MNSTMLLGCTRTSLKPVMKVTEKIRLGSKVKKKYDRARTLFRRVLGSFLVAEQKEEELKQEYTTLNPVELKRAIMRLQDRLSAVTPSKRNEHKENQNVVTLEYIFLVRQRMILRLHS